MHWAVRHKDSRYLKAALLHGGNPNLEAEPLAGTPLFTAMGPEGKEKVNILLDAGADMNAQNANGDTPMVVAARLGQFDVVLELLKRGADYQLKNHQGLQLRDVIEYRRKTMDPNNKLTSWMHKVIAWLDNKGA